MRLGKILTMLVNGVASLVGGSLTAFAHCPVCTAAAVGAVAASRYYGVNDSIVGVFIGALALSTGLWANNAMKKRGWTFIPSQGFILSLASILHMVVSLHV